MKYGTAEWVLPLPPRIPAVSPATGRVYVFVFSLASGKTRASADGRKTRNELKWSGVPDGI